MRRDVALAIMVAVVAHGALLMAVRGLPDVERLREFVRVRIVAVNPQAPVVTSDTVEKSVEPQPAVRKPPSLVRNSQPAESQAAGRNPRSALPQTAAPNPQTPDGASQPAAPAAESSTATAAPAAPVPTTAAAGDVSAETSQPPAVAGKALATLCPTLLLPHTLLGQGFFPRRYLVRLAAQNAPQEDYSIASFEPEGDPLAFVDEKVATLVGQKCRFTPAALTAVLGRTMGAQGESIVLAIAEGG